MYTQTKTHIIAEMLKDADEEGVELARQLIEAVFSCSVITSDWEGSFILNLYKGKGEAPGRGNYRDIKLTDQVIKRHKQVLDGELQRDATWLCAWQRHHWRYSRCSPAGMGCACHSSHVLQCPESYAGQ